MSLNITTAIIILTCVISIPAFSRDKIKDDLLFWPYAIKRNNQWYRFLTCGFLHADTMHLIFNMVSLYSFGMAIEKFLYPIIFSENTRVLYVVLYISAIIFACIPDFFRHKNDPYYRALGASGAVSAIIFAAITIQPNMPIRFFFIPIDIPGYIFGLVFLALSAYLAKRGGDNIGHNAHFWGAVYGVVFTWIAGKAFVQIDLLKRFMDQVF